MAKTWETVYPLEALKMAYKSIDEETAKGLTGTTEVLYNPSYEVLFNEETKEGLEGFEVGQETELFCSCS